VTTPCQLLHHWVPRRPPPPTIGPATDIVTADGIGVGSHASDVTVVFGVDVYHDGATSIQIVPSSGGLAVILYLNSDQRVVGIVTGRNDCGEGS